MWIQNSYSCYSRATAFTPLRCYWPKVCTSGWQIVEKLSNIHFCRHRNCLSIANIGKQIPYFWFNDNTRKNMFFFISSTELAFVHQASLEAQILQIMLSFLQNQWGYNHQPTDLQRCETRLKRNGLFFVFWNTEQILNTWRK